MLVPHRPVRGLEVLGVRYNGSRPAPDDERCLDAYIAAAVYWEPGLPVVYTEPVLPSVLLTADEPANLGLVCRVVAEAVAGACRNGRAPLVTGGDCTHSVGVLAGLQRHYGPTARIGLVWFDAHGDFNTPRTTPSGMLGGMPVAVCAGLAHPSWREGAGVQAPLPTDRIVFVDVRNLDPPEAILIHATDAIVAAVEPGRPGFELEAAIQALAARCELLYLHIDSDILDAALVPNHGTREPGGPDLSTVVRAIDLVLATGKVAACAVVSVFGMGEGRELSVAAGVGLISAALESWRRSGMPGAREP